MLRSDYDGQTCSIARTLEIVGERWTMLVLRDVFLGLRRFDEIQSDLGVARNTLTNRLDKLVDAGILERVPYQERPVRHEYLLTEKGLDLWPVIVSLLQWGDEYAPSDAGRPVLLRHRGCGGELDRHRVCTTCGAALGPRDVEALPGPGVSPDHPLMVRRAQAEQAKARAVR
ncbi:winged helix-turn-helix transcriptional regulator [Paraconexibacter sp.]|uniref:winged helix-turn-helix transcriptional regulator n=1 Tax=Paraconexibacter sp. TaxID=2949640 RepID=UPI003563E55F